MSEEEVVVILTSTVGSRHPSHHGVRQVHEAEHVAERGTAGGQAGRAEEALDETEDDEAGEVADQRRRDGQDDEEEHGNDVDRVPPDPGDLAQGREDEGPDAVAQDVHAQAERGDDIADAELGDDAGDGGDVDGGGGVDDEGVEADEQGEQEALPVGPVVWVGLVVGVVPVDEDGARLCLLGDDGDGFRPRHLGHLVELETGLVEGRPAAEARCAGHLLLPVVARGSRRCCSCCCCRCCFAIPLGRALFVDVVTLVLDVLARLWRLRPLVLLGKVARGSRRGVDPRGGIRGRIQDGVGVVHELDPWFRELEAFLFFWVLEILVLGDESDDLPERGVPYGIPNHGCRLSILDEVLKIRTGSTV